MLEIKNSSNLVKTSYSRDDVVILLKDLSNNMKELSTQERERKIQSGVHYSEMLPQEKEPSERYQYLYDKALVDKKDEIAKHIATVSEIIVNNTVGKKAPVIISLARAGIPIGILIKRYIKWKYNMDCSHYAISIIRDRGIDINAMNYIYTQEVYMQKNTLENFFFVDGWTGKGAIKNQLTEAVNDLKSLDNKWSDLKDYLYVLADPANITKLCGTHEDYLIPSACLNSTVSGLISRTILNSYVDVENGEFHGAVYFERFKSIDRSNQFIDVIRDAFENITDDINVTPVELTGDTGMEIVTKICQDYDVADYKKVKPGIGETTRVLLRRVPYKILINNNISMDDPDIQHILVLCDEKNVIVERASLGRHYKVCGIIKELSADA